MGAAWHLGEVATWLVVGQEASCPFPGAVPILTPAGQGNILLPSCLGKSFVGAPYEDHHGPILLSQSLKALPGLEGRLVGGVEPCCPNVLGWCLLEAPSDPEVSSFCPKDGLKGC